VSGVEILLGILLGLLVNETTDLSPWLGRTFVTWSARLRYGETDHGTTRAEELRALIDARPGKLFKLVTGTGFLSSALLFKAMRLLGRDTAEEEPPSFSDLSDLPGSRGFLPLEDEPTTLVARYLFPTERYRGEWKRHWISLVKAEAVILLYAALGVWAVQLRIKPQYQTNLTVGICVVAAILFAWQLPRWYFHRFTLTNKRIMVVSGVLRRRVEMLPLLRVTDVRYTQSILGRLLSYGTFQNDSAGWRKPMRRLHDLPNPNELYLRMIEEMYEPQAVEARLGKDDDEDHGLTPEEAASLDSLLGKADLSSLLWPEGDGDQPASDLPAEIGLTLAPSSRDGDEALHPTDVKALIVGIASLVDAVNRLVARHEPERPADEPPKAA
jgi:membrane protein YdbS with pleckstrin-like domain